MTTVVSFNFQIIVKLIYHKNIFQNQESVLTIPLSLKPIYEFTLFSNQIGVLGNKLFIH